MPPEIVITPRLREQLEALSGSKPHAVLLSGVAGLGKRTLAAAWSATLSSVPPIVLEPDEKGSIGISEVRRLYQHTRAKQEGHQTVIIDHAETLSTEAQNALLKLLEEPRSGVTFILTAPSADALLPTILSRVQVVHCAPVSDDLLKSWLSLKTPGLDPTASAQLLFIAAGRPGMATLLLNEPEQFAHFRGLMQHAKRLVTADPYDRFVIITPLLKQKDDVVFVLEATAHMLKIQLGRAPSPRLIQLADGLQDCLAAIAANGNVRTHIAKLFTSY